jgi:hypothetical protein
MENFMLPVASGAVTAALGSVSSTGLFGYSTQLLNSLGWKAAGDYRQLGASYALATAVPVYFTAAYLGHPRPLMIALASGAIMGVAGWQQLDPKIFSAIGDPGYGIEGGSGGAQGNDFTLYRAATIFAMVGASVAIAEFLV